jgi:5'-methylthioadenosine phosphorylase
MNNLKASIGVIGGTGVYTVDNKDPIAVLNLETDWGFPSDEIKVYAFERKGKSVNVAFLPRHGQGHFHAPSKVPQKANIAALKMLGVEEIIAFSAVGSLKEEIEPRHFVLPSQIIDRTRHREDTFFDEGIVMHASFGDPFSASLNEVCARALQRLDMPYHQNQVLMVMEGPLFSTRAESKLYRSWGADIINMTTIPEAKLARELEMSYQVICMSTDYDSWRESEESVTAEQIMAVIKDNSENAQKALNAVLEELIEVHPVNCPAKSAVRYSVITAPAKRPPAVSEKMKRLLPHIF